MEGHKHMTLKDGETIEVKGSARDPYLLKNQGGVLSCTCPAWRNQSQPIDKRTCKHLRKALGDAHEAARIGGSLAVKAGKTAGKVTAVPPALLLANVWTPDVDPTGWWMSEKMDGVRGYWDGKEMISRLGNKFYLPEWFRQQMPAVPLDGELWMGRGLFQETVSIVRTMNGDDKLWRKVGYVVFDLPASKEIFEVRQKAMQMMCRNQSSQIADHVWVLTHKECGGIDHLREELERVEDLDGEGMMLRQPRSLYEPNRSSTLLKVKTFHDAEAVVTEHVPGAGRFAGMMGALWVKTGSKKFKIGTGFSDKERRDPPPVGSKVTFRYTGLSKDGIPRPAAYVGPAIDK